MKHIAAILLAFPLIGCGPDYEANFRGEDLGCSGCIVRDTFHKPPQPLEKGQSKLGETAVWKTSNKTLGMELTAPPADAGGNPQAASMGIFSTGHNFGPNSFFSVSATFQRPSNIAATPKSFAVGVVARTGDRDDLPDLKRLQLTFRIRNAAAELRVQEVSGPTAADFHQLASVPVRDEDYAKIFGKAQPFTLKLRIDRKAGTGSALLTTDGQKYPLGPFKMQYFTASSGDALTTLGAALANPTAPGQTRFVEVTHFEIRTR